MSESPGSKKPEDKSLTAREAYNVVSDLVAGPNLRVKDNVFQGLAILFCAGLGALIGFLITMEPFGAVFGVVGGLVVGLLGSGFALMIYRAIRHARGKHD